MYQIVLYALNGFDRSASEKGIGGRANIRTHDWTVFDRAKYVIVGRSKLNAIHRGIPDVAQATARRCCFIVRDWLARAGDVIGGGFLDRGGGFLDRGGGRTFAPTAGTAAAALGFGGFSLLTEDNGALFALAAITDADAYEDGKHNDAEDGPHRDGPAGRVPVVAAVPVASKRVEADVVSACIMLRVETRIRICGIGRICRRVALRVGGELRGVVANHVGCQGGEEKRGELHHL